MNTNADDVALAVATGLGSEVDVLFQCQWCYA